RDLWPGIAARLDALTLPSAPTASSTLELRHAHRAPEDAEPAGARVLAFRVPPVRQAPPLRNRWLAAAAVALVTLSSGATYLAMRRPNAAGVVATTSAAPPTAASPRTSLPTHLPDVAREDPAETERLAAVARRPAAAASPQEYDETRIHPTVLAVARSVDATVPGAADYDREIADLRAVVAERHGQLDSATVDVLARNLRIIDVAIAASRAALAHDPHSPFLGEQLTRALGQKIDLLRTAALLPRT
ncbi:MAG: hypothetical protein M3154_01505, partial [Candidatus Eremiobacteraeota bacterium]|nr:hypothetical protein [Candidatus Eremiobacteraeota bacterium]